ncbi:MAG: hypothetical protein Q9O62_05400 [Ardenticatenia bacterium]|nr:hypothetical protein [Ardenticatenia bacterium]
MTKWTLKIRALRRAYEHLHYLIADLQECQPEKTDPQLVALVRQQAHLSRQMVAREQARRSRRRPAARGHVNPPVLARVETDQRTGMESAVWPGGLDVP